MHGEERYRCHTHEERVGAQQVDKVAREFLSGIQRNAADDVPQRDANQEGRESAADAEANVPHLPPPVHGQFAAEFDGHGAEDQRHEQQHEGQVKAGKHRGIDHGERGEERAAARDKPHLVAVPHRADGVEHHPALLIGLGEKVQRAHAEVEAIEDGVAGEQDAHQGEPDAVQ